MKCFNCGKKFSEKELELSHDIPKYMGGIDSDGRHYLCKKCHKEYELEILKVVLMQLIRFKFPKDWKIQCQIAANTVKQYFFKNAYGGYE